MLRTTMRESNAADYSLAKLLPLIDYFSPERIARLATERTCLVAETDGRVIATGALDGCELVTFFVLPTHQRGGVGAQLLNGLEAIARTRQCGQLRVHSSLAGVGFYERNGYRRTGVRPASIAGEQIELLKDFASPSIASSHHDPGA